MQQWLQPAIPTVIIAAAAFRSRYSAAISPLSVEYTNRIPLAYKPKYVIKVSLLYICLDLFLYLSINIDMHILAIHVPVQQGRLCISLSMFAEQFLWNVSKEKIKRNKDLLIEFISVNQIKLIRFWIHYVLKIFFFSYKVRSISYKEISVTKN